MPERITRIKIGKDKDAAFNNLESLYEKEKHLISQSFFFEGANGKAVLLVHGWTAVPYELRRLGTYLNENGYAVSGPILKGHATVPEDLENVRWEDWLASVEEAYNELAQKYDQVHIIGTSIGAVLAMMVAREKKGVTSLTLMAMPYRLRMEKFLFFVLRMIAPFKKYAKKAYPPSFGFSESITRRTAYRRYPIASVLEVFHLVRHAREKLSEVTQPSFIMQSEIDNIIDRKSAEEIYARIGSKIKKKKHIKRAYHTFISDIRNEHVFEDILKFIEEN
ncbi:MAG: alpha/beta fold hydrolase [Candidatus Moranbacteria bacterium]|nr:alpha/beta fold hydrolase [Candidatus Moranbacteria bacterium]